METITGLAEAYGPYLYALLFLYCSAKSGSLPLFAGVLASTGGLDLTGVAVATFLGAYAGDEARYWAAKRYGDRLLRKEGRFARGLKQAASLLEKYGVFYLFLFRYPKGMRTIGALPVGLTSMPWTTFTVFSFLSALVWTIVMIGTGYLLGESIVALVEQGFGMVSVLLLLATIAAVLSVYAVKRWSTQRLKQPSA